MSDMASKRKYVSKGLPRKKHEMTKRQNLGSKRSTETPPDKRGNFYLSENVQDWYGAKCTSKFPNLF